jgi:HlyD family secretion protein
MVRKWWGIVLSLLSLLMALAVGCGSASGPSPTPIPSPPDTAPPWTSGSSGGPTVSASGEVVAEQGAQMGFAMAGQVATVDVELGDEVEEGELLVALEASTLQAGVAQAEAALQAVRAQLAELQAGPRPAQLAAAQAAYRTALAQYRKIEASPSEQDLRTALVALRKAEAALVQAQAAYDEIAWVEKVTEMPQSLALQLATLDYEGALANYEFIAQGALPEDLEVAWANVESAQAQVDLLEAGASAEQIAAAEAAVAQAQAALDTAGAALDQATLHAPFAGTVAALEVSPGEIVLPGQGVVTVANLQGLRVETTDLSERDVDRVRVGQEATIYVEALGVDVPGRVAHISPLASTVGGDVVYTVVLDLDEQPAGLRLGMSAEVEIATE